MSCWIQLAEVLDELLDPIGRGVRRVVGSDWPRLVGSDWVRC